MDSFRVAQIIEKIVSIEDYEKFSKDLIDRYEKEIYESKLNNRTYKDREQTVRAEKEHLVKNEITKNHLKYELDRMLFTEMTKNIIDSLNELNNTMKEILKK